MRSCRSEMFAEERSAGTYAVNLGKGGDMYISIGAAILILILLIIFVF
jgi:uncharacterized integral membrane protein